MSDEADDTTIGRGGWALVIASGAISFLALRFALQYHLFPALAFALAIALIVLLILYRLAVAVNRHDDAEAERHVRRIVPASAVTEGTTRVSGIEGAQSSPVVAVPVRPEAGAPPSMRPAAVVTPLSRVEPAPILPPQPVVAPPPPEPPSKFVSAPEDADTFLPDVWARPARAPKPAPEPKPEPKPAPAAKAAAPVAKAAPAAKAPAAKTAAPAAKAAPVAKPEPKAAPEATAKAKPATSDKPKVGFKTKADLEAEAAAKLAAAQKAAEPKPKAAEPKAKAEPKPEPKPAAKAKVAAPAAGKPKAEPKAEPTPKPAAKPKATPKPKAEKPVKAGLVRLSAPRGGVADDLKEIEGIGPAIEKLVNGLGFYHFDQVAAWTEEDVAKVDAELRTFKGRITRDKWVEQARIIVSEGLIAFRERAKTNDY